MDDAGPGLPTMTGLARLLGIAAHDDAAAIDAALGRVDGPTLVQHAEAAFVAFAQKEPIGPRRSLSETERLCELRVVHRRLTAACRAAPFLPANPAAALCPVAELPALLAAAEGLSKALAKDGATHQWEVTLWWPAEHRSGVPRPHMPAGRSFRAAQGDPQPRDVPDIAAERAARLEAALAPSMLRLKRLPSVDGRELRFALLIPRMREEIIERALQSLPEDLSAGGSAHLQGPMPPVDFAAWQVAEAEERALRAAWAVQGLPDKVEAETLRRRRQGRASAHGRMRDPAQPPALLPECGEDAELAALLPLARRRLVPIRQNLNATAEHRA